MDEDTTTKLSKVISVDEGVVRKHLDEVVRESVEETLNGLLPRGSSRCSKNGSSEVV